MTRCAITLAVALLQCAGVSTAAAQTIDDLRINIQVSGGRVDGGDRRSTAWLVNPSEIGKTSTVVFFRLVGQCGTGVGPGPVKESDQAWDGTDTKLYSAWTVQVTPLARTGEAITFRVRWTRNLDNGKPSTRSDEAELTLRPEESSSLDVMAQSPQPSPPPASCVIRSLSLDASIQRDPEPDRDRRLLAVDLWLVERLSDGKERSQALSLRGLYYQPIPFYFESLTEGAKSLDVFGELTVSPGARTNDIKITTRSRVIDPAAKPPVPGPIPSYLTQYVGSKATTLVLAPDEVVSVILPPVGREAADAAVFASRALSYRIRVRQIR